METGRLENRRQRTANSKLPTADEMKPPHDRQPGSAGKQLRRKTETRRFQRQWAEAYNGRSLKLLLQDWTDPYNVGGLFRVADACGAGEVLLTGRTPAPPDPQIAVTSLGHHRRVKWRHFDRHDDALKALKDEGFQLVAVEVAENAVHYRDFAYSEKVCLILGNEVKGVYPNVLKACDAAVLIPMAGKGRSINVHVAAAVVAFEVLLSDRA